MIESWMVVKPIKLILFWQRLVLLYSLVSVPNGHIHTYVENWQKVKLWHHKLKGNITILSPTMNVHVENLEWKLNFNSLITVSKIYIANYKRNKFTQINFKLKLKDVTYYWHKQSHNLNWAMHIWVSLFMRPNSPNKPMPPKKKYFSKQW